MIPLQVKWHPTKAYIIVCNCWIAVQLGLHALAPGRIRRKFIRAADWLEATINFMARRYQGHHLLHNDEEIDAGSFKIAQAYHELQHELSSLQRRESLVREDIDEIRTRVLALLNVCALKDAHVPLMQLDHTPVRYGGRSRINNVIPTHVPAFTMSRRDDDLATPHRPPRGRGVRGVIRGAARGGTRIRPLHRDTSSYADMLIEQLLAAQATSPLTDSDSSPPSDAAHTAAAENNNNNVDKDDKKVQPTQLYFPSPSQPRPKTVGGPLNLISGARLSPAPMLLCHDPPHYHEAPSVTSPGIANTTHGSTPELPTSESSNSLDIPFASLFDQLERQDALSREAIHDISGLELLPDPASPVLPRGTSYNFPVRYSHSYARELQRIESVSQTESSISTAENTLCSQQDFSPTKPTSPEPETSMIKGECQSATAQDMSNIFEFSEPLVVSLPPLSHARKFDKSNLNLNKNYKPLLGNKKADFSFEVDDDDDISSRPPIPPRRPLTDSKVGRFVVQSSQAEVGTIWHDCQRNTSYQKETAKSSKHYHSPRPLADSNPNISCSFHDVSNASAAFQQDEALTMSTGRAYWTDKQELARRDRHVTLRDRALREDDREVLGENISHQTNSASKRRKGNDTSALPVIKSETKENKSVRQRLFPSPAASTRPPRRKKRQSPAMRRLSQQKENNALSPASPPHPSPGRKPFSDVYNIRLNESEVLTTSSNSLTNSSEMYARSSETSPDMPLISREEELLERDAFYCDFTVDRQYKIDAMSAKKQRPFQAVPSSEERRYILRDPSTHEILVRKVEGAETASTRQPTTRVPRQSIISNTSVDDDSFTVVTPDKFTSRRLSESTKLSNRGQSYSHSQVSSSSSVSSSRQASPQRSRTSSRSARKSGRKKCTTHPMASSTLIMEPESSPPSPEAVSESVYTWSIEEDTSSCNLEKSYVRSRSAKKRYDQVWKTPRPATSVGRDSPKQAGRSEITDMVQKLDAALNRRLSWRCEVSGRNLLAGAPSMIFNKSKNFNRSKAINRSKAESDIGHDSAAYSSQHSNMLSSNASTSSMFLNRARASIQCSSNDGSQSSNLRQVSYDRSHHSSHHISYDPSSHQDSSETINPSSTLSIDPCGLSRQMSASEPSLRQRVNGSWADQSLVPSDTDTTPEEVSVSTSESQLNDRTSIPGNSSPSADSNTDSGCTAARCRPWSRLIVRSVSQVQQKPYESLVEPTSPNGAVPEGETAQQQQQDLLDSILTDSPKSVDSSGIFAPYNSYNSPVESVGSHNGYSSTVSSNVTSSDTNYNCNVYRSRASGCTAPPPTPPHSRFMQSPEPETRRIRVLNINEGSSTSTVNAASVRTSLDTSTSTFVGKATPQAKKSADDVTFKRPFTPAPHIDHTSRPTTRNQGVTAESPSRPVSVRSDSTDQLLFAVPPGVVTGPPKIKDKKSLVRKFKKFSSHFYKKEKIKTLANL